MGNYSVGIFWRFSHGRHVFSFDVWNYSLSQLNMFKFGTLRNKYYSYFVKNPFIEEKKTKEKIWFLLYFKDLDKEGARQNYLIERIRYVHGINIGTFYDNNHTYCTCIYFLYTQVHTHTFLSLYHKLCHCSV